jgi:hypothetical protein
MIVHPPAPGEFGPWIPFGCMVLSAPVAGGGPEAAEHRYADYLPSGGHPRGIETPLEAGLRRSWDWITGRR